MTTDDARRLEGLIIDKWYGIPVTVTALASSRDVYEVVFGNAFADDSPRLVRDLLADRLIHATEPTAAHRDPHWPHDCPACGGPAWISQTVDCKGKLAVLWSRHVDRDRSGC